MTEQAPRDDRPDDSGARPRIHDVRSGVLWATSEQAAARLISFGVFAVLARLLVPEAFGLLALAMVVISLGQRLAEQGLSELIVREHRLTKGSVESALTLNVGGGLLLTLVCVITARPVASTIGEPDLAPIVAVLSVNLLMTALAAVPMALLQRAMSFRMLAKVTLTASLLGGGAGIVGAVCGLGVWSLVGQQLIGATCTCIFSWVACGWYPQCPPKAHIMRSQLAFGSRIIGARLGNLANRQGDDFFVGTFLGAPSLGFYNLAYRVLLTATHLTLGAFRRVALPAFSSMLSTGRPLQTAYRESLAATCLVTFPIFVGVALTAEPLVEVLFGDQWTTSASLLRIIAPIGVAHAAVCYVDPLLIATGQVRVLMRLELISAALNIIAFGVASQFSLRAVAMAFVCVSVALLPVRIELLRRCLDIGPSTYLRPLLVCLVLTALMATVVLWLATLLPRDTSPLMRLGLLTIGGAATYSLGVVTIGRTLLASLRAYMVASKTPPAGTER